VVVHHVYLRLRHCCALLFGFHSRNVPCPGVALFAAAAAAACSMHLAISGFRDGFHVHCCCRNCAFSVGWRCHDSAVLAAAACSMRLVMSDSCGRSTLYLDAEPAKFYSANHVISRCFCSCAIFHFSICEDDYLPLEEHPLVGRVWVDHELQPSHFRFVNFFLPSSS